MNISIDLLNFYLSITKNEAINWGYLAKAIIPNNNGNSKAYNVLLQYPEFVDAVYKSGCIELT